jgi:hypothetical protein
MNGNNPFWPYWLGNTLNFTYNGKEVWGTIRKFGNGFVTMITKDGHRNYRWEKMSPIVLYQCAIAELIKGYQWRGDERFKYLYDFYGPYEQPYPWKMD